MEFVKLLLNQSYGNYSYAGASNEEMGTLGLFLTDDVGCGSSAFKEWGLNDSWGDSCSGNCTGLEKDSDYILLRDLYSEENNVTVLKITKEQYLQVITDWEDKVCKLRPQEVIIKYENNRFVVETKN